MLFRGKTILVTRPIDQAAETIVSFEQQGAKVIHLPLLEIVDPSDHYASLDEALAQLYEYHWIVFTSQNAVRRFFSRPLAPAAEEVSARCAAVGPVTAKLLRELGIDDIVVATDVCAEGLLQALEPYSFERKRVLFPRAQEGREIIAEGLRQRGAIVDVVEAYRTLHASALPRDQLMKLVKEGAVDMVHFASPSAVHVFMEMMLNASLEAAVHQIDFLALGATTLQALQTYGVRVQEI